MTRRTAVARSSTGAKTATTKAAMEATAIAGRVETGAATTAMMGTMVTATTMTRLNVCDALMEEKEHLSNLSRTHATINRRESKSREGRKTVVGAEESGAGAGKDLEEEKGDNTTTNNCDDRQHTTIKQNMVEGR